MVNLPNPLVKSYYGLQEASAKGQKQDWHTQTHMGIFLHLSDSLDQRVRDTVCQFRTRNGVEDMIFRSIAQMVRYPNWQTKQYRLQITLIPSFSNTAGCKLALIPRSLPNGTPGFEWATYLFIARQGERVRQDCTYTGQGGWKTMSTESNLVIVLYQPSSPYDNYVTAEIAAGRPIRGDIPHGVPFGDPQAQAPPAPPVDPLADDASSSAVGPPATQRGGPVCGQYCSSVNLCTGNDACKCIADPWGGTGGFFTGSCKMPYFASGGSGRELSEIDSNSSTSAINGPGTVNATQPAFDPATMVLGDTGFACPCNCTYVSKACCFAEGGVVYEAPSLKLGALKLPDAKVICDTTTGEFRSGG